MRLLYLGWILLPPASWPSVCLTPSSPPGHSQPAPPSALSLSHFFFHQLRCRIFCIHRQCSLLYYIPFHFVSYRHNMSTFLRSIISASSLPLPVIVSIFKVPTLMSERLPFHASHCFFTRFPPLFLLLFSLCLAVAQFPQVPCCATPEAVVGNPGLDRSGMD